MSFCLCGITEKLAAINLTGFSVVMAWRQIHHIVGHSVWNDKDGASNCSRIFKDRDKDIGRRSVFKKAQQNLIVRHINDLCFYYDSIVCNHFMV